MSMPKGWGVKLTDAGRGNYEVWMKAPTEGDPKGWTPFGAQAMVFATEEEARAYAVMEAVVWPSLLKWKVDIEKLG